MAPKLIAKRYILEGKVQGVGCRAQVLELALQIGHLSGFVMNLPDGRVAVEVKGPDWRVKDFEGVLEAKLNPPVQVTQLLKEEIPMEQLSQTGFVIKRD